MSDATKALELLEGVKSDFDVLKSSVDELKSDKLSATEAVDMKATIGNIEAKMDERDQEIEKLTKAIDQAKAKNELMAGIDTDAQKRKEVAEFAKGLRDIASDKISHFKTEDFKSVQERKDYNSGDDAQGGATVIPFLDSMIDKLVRERTDIFSLASSATISADKWEQLKMNQANGAIWEKSMSDFTSQTKNNTFSQLNILVENLHAIAIFSDDLINDSAFDIVGEILTSISEDYALALGTSFWTGNGLGELSGILNAPDATDSFNGIERVATAASTTVTFDDIYSLIGALKLPYEPRAQFKSNRLGITAIRKLKDSQNRYLWQPSNIVGVPATLAGFPISQAPELATDIEAANAEGLVFGDFNQGYKLINRAGMNVLRDNLTQYPNVAYKVKSRIGGGVVKGEALKILKTQA
jgi:HK97 family phage major capsid protein